MKRSEYPITVALVGCSKKKASTESGLPAKDLYKGRLCQLGYDHAIEMEWDVHFLSALHGVVSPYQSIPPYDYSMVNIPLSKRGEWGHRVVGQLLDLYPMFHLNIVFFSGRDYIDPVIQEGESQEAYWTYQQPLKGLDLFARMRWFKAHSTNLVA